MEKVAAYCRVSTEEQRERQSIETQIEYAKQYCQREGCLIVEFYCDDGVSGTIPFEEREAGNRLFRDALEGKFKTVLVYKIDRIGRDNLVTLEAVFKLTKLGIDIKSMTEVSDRSNPQGRFIFNLFANLAEWEKEQIRERTIDGRYRKARSGKIPGGNIPYGYFVNGQKFLEINETPLPSLSLSPADVVRQIFSLIGEEGMSTISLAERLSIMGIPSPKGRGIKGETYGKWAWDRVRKIIRNTAYIGTFIYGRSKSRSDNLREQVSIPVPPIVSEELWIKAQETLKRNRKFAKRNSKHQYLLRGLIKCNFCGQSYVGHIKFGEKHYYRCLSRVGNFRKVYGDCPRKGKTIRQDWIEGVVWDEIKNWILNPIILEEVISEKLKESEKEKGNSLSMYSKLKNSIEKKKEERTRILDLYRKGVISMEDVEKQLQAVESEEKALFQMGEELKSQMIENLPRKELLKGFEGEMDAFRRKLDDGPMTFKDKQKIVQTFVKEVKVTMNGRKAGRPSLVETIPFRRNAEPISLKDASIVTVYSRDKNTNDEKELQTDYSGNFADVIPIPRIKWLNTSPPPVS